MFQTLHIFQMSGAMAAHAGARQTITAQNIANADTPGYQARTIQSFRDVVANSNVQMRASRENHMGVETSPNSLNLETNKAEIDPNGNSVSVESEMVSAVESVRQHEQALAIYRHGLTVLRTSLGR